MMKKSLIGCRVLAAINGCELFGHEKGNIEVFKVLQLMGAEVVVGINVINDGGAVGNQLCQLGFETFDLPFSNQWSWQWLKKYPGSLFKKPLAVLECSKIFHRKINEFKPTHIHLGSSLAYSFISLALMLHKVPLIYRMGDCPPADSPFNMLIWRSVMRRSSRRVAISDYVRRCVLAEGFKSHALIYNFSSVPGLERSDRECILARNRRLGPSIIYVGAVSEHKGLLVLIEAFVRVAVLFPELELSIVGKSAYDGAFRSRLIQRVSQLGLERKIKFHDFASDPSSFYDNSLIHVAPSICEEALGNVVLEAKTRGVPSVVFPSGGLPEMIRHKVDGYVCPEKSADSLAEAILWMLSDMSRLSRMSLAALDDSSSRFGYPDFLSDWAKVYSSVGHPDS